MPRRLYYPIKMILMFDRPLTLKGPRQNQVKNKTYYKYFDKVNFFGFGNRKKIFDYILIFFGIKSFCRQFFSD